MRSHMGDLKIGKLLESMWLVFRHSLLVRGADYLRTRGERWEHLSLW